MKKLIPCQQLCIALSLVFLTLSAELTNAQSLKITMGSTSEAHLVKRSTSVNFSCNGDNYFVTKQYKAAVMHYFLNCYTSAGEVAADGEITIPVGVFNNSFSIDNILPLGNNVYTFVEHLDNTQKKNTLLVKKFQSPGILADDETELMSIPFEKMMNSGENYEAISPDKNTLAIVGEMPFQKEQQPTFMVSVFDKDLKKIKSGEVKLPVETKKSKNLDVFVSNNGIVYLLKKSTSNKGEIALMAYQWDGSNENQVKSYLIDVMPPQQIFSFTAAVNPQNELVVCATLYDRHTFSAGETKINGVLFFSNKGLSDKNLKVSPLDQPVENLTARQILFSDQTAFFTAEQYKETEEPQPAGSTSFDYNYNYSHKDDYVFGFMPEGEKKFQIQLQKDLTSRNMDKQHYSGYFVCSGKLTVLQNDQSRKYFPSGTYEGYEVPVLTQITTDGLMQSPVIFKDKLRLEYGFALYPSVSVQAVNNQLAVLMCDGERYKLVTIKID